MAPSETRRVSPAWVANSKHASSKTTVNVLSSSLEVGLNTSGLRHTDTVEHPRGKEISLNYRRT